MYKKILVPIDLADENSWQSTLPIAVKFAQLFDGSILVATVIRDAKAFWEGAHWPFAYEALIAQSAQELSTIVRNDVPSGVSVITKVGYGSIYREILRLAEDDGVDLILMTAQRPGVREYFIGPNASHVVRHARCSVLVVRGE